jgi:hypothetical protein
MATARVNSAMASSWRPRPPYAVPRQTRLRALPFVELDRLPTLCGRLQCSVELVRLIVFLPVRGAEARVRQCVVSVEV